MKMSWSGMSGWRMSGWFISFVVVAWTAGCARETASNLPEAPASTAPIAEGESFADSSNSSESSQDQVLKPRSDQSPLLASAKPDSSLPVPNLIPPTASAVRVPQSEVGRPDPFATILVPPTVTFKPATNASPSTTATSPAPPVTPSVAAAPSLPSLQTAPITQFPPISVPNLPPPRPLSETIEISGVVEVGGKTSVIVKSPDEHTSRYVHVGDYIGNGKVLVKRVEMGVEPVVVLEENGAEVTRYVGSGSSLAGLL